MTADTADRRSRPGPPTGVQYPTREDSFARWASEVVGGPAGRRLTDPAHSWWWAGPVLVAVGAAVVAVGLLRYQHCRINGWTTPGQFVHTCYSDVAVLYSSAGGTPSTTLGLDGGTGVGQPAVVALLMAAVALLVPLGRRLDATLQGSVPTESGTGEAAAVLDVGPRLYFDLTSVVIAVAVVVTVLAVVALAGRRPWDAGLVAWSPVVALAGLVSLDLAAVALAVSAVWAWSRERPWLAGMLLGLAVGARPHLVVLALVLVLLAAREANWGPVSRALSAAAIAWSVPNLVVLAAAPNAWLQPLRQWWVTEPEVAYGSLGFVVEVVADAIGAPLPEQSGPALSVLSLSATLAVVLAVGWWVLRAPRVPRLPVIVLVLLVGMFLVGKTVPVQAAVALLPWAALAVPRYRPHLWWWAAEAAYVVAVWQHLVGQTTENRALPAGYYCVFLVLRLGALAWLAWLGIRTVTRPETDLVRLTHRGADPTTGPVPRWPARAQAEGSDPRAVEPRSFATIGGSGAGAAAPGP